MKDEILDHGCGECGGCGNGCPHDKEIDEELDEIIEKECGCGEREYKSLKGCKPQTDHVIHGYDGFSEDEATADLLEAGEDDMFDRPYEDFAEYVMVPDADGDESIVSGSES